MTDKLVYICIIFTQAALQCLEGYSRAWDFTKILGGIRDLHATREVGLAKTWHGYGLGKRKVFEIAHEKSSGCGILVKKRAGMRDQDPPLQSLALASILEAGPGGEDPPSFLRTQLNFLACILCFPNSDQVMLSGEFAYCLFIRWIYMRMEIVLCGTIT